jgi:hypothetical protein
VQELRAELTARREIDIKRQLFRSWKLFAFFTRPPLVLQCPLFPHPTRWEKIHAVSKNFAWKNVHKITFLHFPRAQMMRSL